MHDVRAADLLPGEFATLTAPSLFGGGCLVIVRSAQDASKDVAAELDRYAAAPAPDVVLVLTHAGGAKGKALLASLAKARARRIDCPPIKRFGERLDFLRAEFSQAGRKADDGGPARAARRGRHRPARSRRGVRPAGRRYHRGDQRRPW